MRFTVLCAVVLGAVLGSRTCVAQENWKDTLRQRLPLYGHRNWIVIADSAYPAQVSPGVETIVAGADQLEVLRTVMAEVRHSAHVRPSVYLDKELSYLDDASVSGITTYRYQLTAALGEVKPTEIAHEQIISKLDEAGKTFRVLIIKTNMTMPYTSIFLQLDCAYWTPEQEQQLRTKMGSR